MGYIPKSGEDKIEGKFSETWELLVSRRGRGRSIWTPDIAQWESGDPVAAPARSTGWKVEEEEEEGEEGELSQALTDTGATCSSCSS